MLHGSATGGALKASNNLSDISSVNTAAKNLKAGYVLGQSAVAVSHTGDTAEFTLATVTIPAGAMGANGQVVIEAVFTIPNNANTKTGKVKFGGTAVINAAVATAATIQTRNRVANRNAANSQVFTNSALITAFGSSSTAVGTATIDTTASVDITITGQLGVGTDTITLESYQVVLYPKA